MNTLSPARSLGDPNETIFLRDEWVEVNQIWKNTEQSSALLSFKHNSEMMLSFGTRLRQRGLGSKIQANFRTFLPTVKLRGGIVEMSESTIGVEVERHLVKKG